MLAKALQGATAAADKLYIESVFQTWLYTGNGSTQTITNGIDLSGEGGLVWVKARSSAEIHNLYDTARGANKLLYTNGTAAQVTRTDALTSFTSSGFTLGIDGNFEINTNNTAYASWTFRKAEKFFDVTTATQTTGNTGWLTFNHNLGSAPGAILIKVTNNTDNWFVYHRSTSSQTLFLNLTNAASATVVCQNVTSTSFEFNLANYGSGSGSTYVAYLFAHDAGGYGDSGNDSVVSCGSYTGNGSSISGPSINLGWEPQWLLLKRASGGVANWLLFDNMRGMVVGGDDYPLFPNSDSVEGLADNVSPSATGFTITSSSTNVNGSGNTYIYIAIRRGPMKTPTDATKVFSASLRTGTSATATVSSLAFPTDATLIKTRTASIGYDWNLFDRLRGATKKLATNGTSSESTETNGLNNYASMTGYTLGPGGEVNSSSDNFVDFNFRRAPGFFDVVAYTGTGSARTVSHNLGVVPELMIVKERSNAGGWDTYAAALGSTKVLYLHDPGGEGTSSGAWNNTSPTAAVFTVGINNSSSSYTYIAYLFATCPGVSKCFNYTGTGTTKQIDCGFTNGARLVLIKRTDSTGDWYIWDSARGIISGNDPYLLLNSTAAEVTSTDYIDPYSAGFEISSTAPAAINANGGSYIGLAIA